MAGAGGEVLFDAGVETKGAQVQPDVAEGVGIKHDEVSRDEGRVRETLTSDLRLGVEPENNRTGGGLNTGT